MANLFEVKNLNAFFYNKDSSFEAVKDVSFTLKKGEALGIVGESGAGKTMAALAMTRLAPYSGSLITGGKVLYKGKNLLDLSEDKIRAIRGQEIAYVFQDPLAALNPSLTIGNQIVETIKLHLKMETAKAREHVFYLLDLVEMRGGKERLSKYPHQLSGGQVQRVNIAIALSCNPSLLIADEPTTSLDVVTQAQIITLVKRLKKKLGMAVIWISHDLSVVAGLVDKVAVMLDGTLIETSPFEKLYKNPAHPYTKRLLNAAEEFDMGFK